MVVRQKLLDPCTNLHHTSTQKVMDFTLKVVKHVKDYKISLFFTSMIDHSFMEQ